jgi:hypothetical protein
MKILTDQWNNGLASVPLVGWVMIIPRHTFTVSTELCRIFILSDQKLVSILMGSTSTLAQELFGIPFIDDYHFENGHVGIADLHTHDTAAARNLTLWQYRLWFIDMLLVEGVIAILESST